MYEEERMDPSFFACDFNFSDRGSGCAGEKESAADEDAAALSPVFSWSVPCGLSGFRSRLSFLSTDEKAGGVHGSLLCHAGPAVGRAESGDSEVCAAAGDLFPAPDRILQVFVKDFNLLLSCIAYSYSLLAISWILGVSVGIATGAWLGFSKRADYWLWPFIKALGPIPPVAWIPLALVIFPTMYSGSVFLIFLSIWFPTASLTLAGIRNVNKSYSKWLRLWGPATGTRFSV